MSAGVVLPVDKPAGISSFDVIRRLVKMLGKVKAGHAGTLDQGASGLLLVCIGKATRMISLLQGMDKEYNARVRLGIATDTDDLQGRVIAEAPLPAGLSPAMLEAVLPAFTGDILQIPPVYSALKIDGKRASDRARRGEHIVPVPRPVTIHALEASLGEEAELTLRVRCSKGTYIRSLARDLGRALGTLGTISFLRRTAIGPFRVEDALAVDAFTPESFAAAARPLDAVLAGLPGLTLDAAAARRAGNGVLPAGLPAAGGYLRLLAPDGALLALLVHDGGWHFVTTFTEAGS